MHAYTNFLVFKEHFSSARASHAFTANMKSVIILLGTLATAVLLAEAIVSDWLQL